MKKFLVQLCWSALIFFAVLTAFARVDWLSVFHLENTDIDKKIGRWYNQYLTSTSSFITNEEITQPLDSLLTYLCQANDIPREEINLHVENSSEVNAYAYPGGNLVINSALIEACKNENELLGVMAHEVGHIIKGHATRKLMKEMGLSILLSMTTGGQENIIRSTIKLLSSTAYDRTLEQEADDIAVTYLLRAHIDPSGYGNFMLRMSEEENTPDMMEWINTHPDSRKRADRIFNHGKQDKDSVYKSVLNVRTWETLQQEAGQ
jgi:predicted Zn-dependent protease